MTSPPSTEAKTTTVQRIGWAVLIAVTLYVCYFSHLDVIGFVGPDEPRYAWIARDMAETGDWITPRLYGRPWFEKPPLLYWGGAIFFKILGEDRPEIAARLPSAISAFLATLALVWLAWRSYGEECARWLLLLLPTSVGMIGFSHACATDMPFAGALTIAMVCAAVVLELHYGAHNIDTKPILPRTPWLALILFGSFLGLAVLAKGPAAVILCGGAVFLWALFTKRWRDAFRLLHPAAIAAFCVTALPWYILCARRNPDFFRVFIIEHNFKRYLTPEFQHIQPFWFYVPILLIAFLPWTLLVLAGFVYGLRSLTRRLRASDSGFLLLVWAAFCLVFFTISRSKLPGYVLPAVPVLGLLLARSCASRTFGRSRILRYAALTSTALFLLASGAMSVAASGTAHTSYSLSSLAYSLCVVLFLFGLANAGIWASCFANNMQLSNLLMGAMVVPILLAMLSLNRLSHFLAFWDPSAKVVAQDVLAAKIPANELAVHNMKRGVYYGINFYLGSEVPDWDSSQPKSGYLLLDGRNCQRVVAAAAICEEPPLYLEHSRRLLYRVAPARSLGGLGSGRQP